MQKHTTQQSTIGINKKKKNILLLYDKPRSSEVKELQYPLPIRKLHSILLLTSEDPIQFYTTLGNSESFTLD